MLHLRDLLIGESSMGACLERIRRIISVAVYLRGGRTATLLEWTSADSLLEWRGEKNLVANEPFKLLQDFVACSDELAIVPGKLPLQIFSVPLRYRNQLPQLLGRK